MTNWNTLLRLYTMIAGVSAVSLFVFVELFASTRLKIAVVAVATVALVSVILGFLLAASASFDGGSSTPVLSTQVASEEE